MNRVCFNFSAAGRCTKLLLVSFFLLGANGCNEPEVIAPAPARQIETSAPIAMPLAARPKPAAPVPTPPSANALLEDERNTIDVFRATSDAVVFVMSAQRQRGFFGLSATQVDQGTGSGFVWDDDRHIVTNFHVVRGSNAFSVSFSDGSVHEARLIGVDPYKDLAVLKLDEAAPSPKALPHGSSKSLIVGQKVLAIGNPFGLDHTLTTGVISALGREMQSLANTTIEDVIQTDASINPGNSGGPLLDSSGRLIGVNTSIISSSGNSAGISFAVPVDTMKRVVPQLIRDGRVRRVGIGVRILPDNYSANWGVEGVIVREAVPRGPAANAGLRRMEVDRRGNVYVDVIVGIDGEPVRSFDDMFRAFDTRAPGETVVVHVVRDGRENLIEMVLEELK